MPVKEIRNAAIRGFVGRLTTEMQDAVRQNMLWNLRNCIAYEATQKKEIEELEKYAEQVAAKGSDWGAW
ncbi:hypothetical protein [Massilia sp. TN1-12]|uniref:hypothetical protein n=1 Tax=Massilia paldalensis TaxID=3377675 RepID=UPI00384C2E70